MENIVNVNVIEQNRADLSKFGQVFAKGVFTPNKENVIIDFNARHQQALENNGLFLSRNVQRFKASIVNIMSLAIETDIDGESVVVINKGTKDEFRCPVNNPRFTKDATDDALRESLSASEGNKSYFANGKKVKEAVNRLNVKELEKVENLISELEKIRTNLRTTIANNDAKIDNYYKQLDNKGGVEVSVDVTVDA